MRNALFIGFSDLSATVDTKNTGKTAEKPQNGKKNNLGAPRASAGKWLADADLIICKILPIVEEIARIQTV